MTDTEKNTDTIIDWITGKPMPDVGAEANRQAVERFLVEEKGFAKEDIEVSVDIDILIAGEPYRSQIDLVVGVDRKTRFMAIKCAAGSLGSREREILAASRILSEYPIPYSVVSDGKTAIVLDTVTGKKVGEGLNAVWSKEEAKEKLKSIKRMPFPKERLEREKLIFRSYDILNVNVKRNTPAK